MIFRFIKRKFKKLVEAPMVFGNYKIDKGIPKSINFRRK